MLHERFGKLLAFLLPLFLLFSKRKNSFDDTSGDEEGTARRR